MSHLVDTLCGREFFDKIEIQILIMVTRPQLFHMIACNVSMAVVEDYEENQTKVVTWIRPNIQLCISKAESFIYFYTYL